MKKSILTLLLVATIPYGTWAETNPVVETSQARSPLIDAIDFVNPFWKDPVVSEDFSFTIQFPIVNTGYSPIIPEGKVTLEDNAVFLQGIGVIGASSTSSGKLVDYLPLNEEKREVQPKEEVVFSVEWKGFWDQYIENGNPVLHFTSPSEHYHGDVEPISFWEKRKVIIETRNIVAHAHVSYLDDVTRAITSQEESLPLQITYPRVVKTLNTGLFLFFALSVLLIFFLIKNPKKTQDLHTKRTYDAIADLEAELLQEKKIAENKMKTPSQKSSKKTTASRTKKAPQRKKSPAPTSKDTTKNPE